MRSPWATPLDTLPPWYPEEPVEGDGNYEDDETTGLAGHPDGNGEKR